MQWSTESWTDLLPENSASQTYAYQLPGGDIAVIIDNDIDKVMTLNTLDNATGNVLSSASINYDDLSYYPVLFATTVDFLTHDDGNFSVCFSTTTADSTDAMVVRLTPSLVREMTTHLG